MNTEFLALCYLTSDSKNEKLYSQLKQALSKNLISLSPRSYALIETRKVESVELYPVTTRSVQEHKVLTYRNFEDFYSSKNKAFKYYPECLTLDISKDAGLNFLILSRRSYFSTEKGELNKFELVADMGL